jgi:hypothetical protein
VEARRLRESRLESSQEKSKQINELALMLYAEDETKLYYKLLKDSQLVYDKEVQYKQVSVQLDHIINQEKEENIKYEMAIKTLKSEVEEASQEAQRALAVKLENERLSQEALNKVENSRIESEELNKAISILKDKEMEMKASLLKEHEELKIKLKILEFESENKLKEYSMKAEHLEMLNKEKEHIMAANRIANEELINKQRELLLQQQQHVNLY